MVGPDNGTLLYLSESDVARCAVDVAAVIDAVEAAFAALPRDRPPASRPNAAVGPFVAKTGILDHASLASVKWFGIPADDRDGFAPLLVLSESTHGAPIAILDGKWLTAARTAAITAIAARRLAMPGARRLGFVGSGAQAEAHLDALQRLFPLESITAFSRTAARAGRLCARAERLGLRATPTADARQAIGDMDIVVTSVPLTATSLRLDARMLSPQAFVSMVDRGQSWDRDHFSAFGLIATDDLCLSYPKGPEHLAAPEPFAADIPMLIRDGKAIRAACRGPRALAFSGAGLADTAAAAVIVEAALALGIGLRLPR